MLPDIKATSLSLSFDEQVSAEHSEHGYTNQQILPNPKQHALQTKSQIQVKKQMQRDQENDRTNLQGASSTGFVKGKEQFKQVTNGKAPLNSPSREPLKQILSPNQTHMRVTNQKQTHLPQKPRQEQRTAVGDPNQRRNILGHTGQGRSQATVSVHSTAHSKENKSQTSVKGPNAFHGTDLRNDEQKQKTLNPTMRPKPQGSEGMDSGVFQSLPRQQMILSKQCSEENNGRGVEQQRLVRLMEDESFPAQGNRVEKPFLETVFEEDTVDGTLNKSMSETERELQITATSPVRSVSKKDHKSHGSIVGMSIDREGQMQHGYVQPQRTTEISEERSSCPMDNEENHGKNKRVCNTAGVTLHSSAQQATDKNDREQPKSTEKANVHVHQEGTFQENKQVGNGVSAKRMSEEGLTLPDPYQLLIRQEAQLRELQEQVPAETFPIQNAGCMEKPLSDFLKM